MSAGELAIAIAGDVELVAEPRTRGHTSREVAAMWLATYPEGNTRDAYARDLIGKAPKPTDRGRRAAGRGAPPFFTWCAQQGVDPLQVDRLGVTLWLRSLDPYGLSPATTARKVSAVRGFYRYAVDAAQVLDRSPMPARDRDLHLAPKPSESSTPGLTVEQVRDMVRAALAASTRDAAVLALLYHQGLRAEELCALDVDHMRHDRGHRTLLVHGKGRKVRTQALAPPAARAVDRYMGDRTAQGMLEVLPALVSESIGPGSPLILNEEGRRLDRWRVRSIVGHYARDAGAPGTITPHVLRHTCTTHLLDRGVPIREVQRFLGHSSSATTERYDRRREQLDNSPAYALPGVEP